MVDVPDVGLSVVDRISIALRQDTLFVIVVKYKVPLDEVKAVFEPHREFIKKYAEAGIIITAGALTTDDGGLAIAKNVTKEELTKIMEEDPYWIEGVADFEIFEFKPRFFTL